jgi:carbon monoxide dehydrogenase subunit G
MPGAELTETVDDTTWKGQVTVKLGAMSLTLKGTVSMTERDEAAKRVVLDAKGMEARGKGQAKATVTTTMAATGDGGARVHLRNDLSWSGQAAQMGGA